jgi:hypothetical protein
MGMFISSSGGRGPLVQENKKAHATGRRRECCEIAFTVGLVGVICGVISVAIEGYRSIEDHEPEPELEDFVLFTASNILSLITVITTVACMVYMYKYYMAVLFELNKWSSKRQTLWSAGLLPTMLLELLFWAICPIPGGERVFIHLQDFGRGTYPDDEQYSYDELASLLMQMRFYLLFRVIGERTAGNFAVRSMGHLGRDTGIGVDYASSFRFALRCELA